MLSTYQSSKAQKKQRGFSLLELMISLTVLSIIAFIAIPSLNALVLDNRLSSQTSALIASLQYARSEATNRGMPVSVSALSTTQGQEFSEKGWVVWVGEGTYNSESSEVLRKYGPVSGIRIGGGDRYTFSSKGFVSYFPNNGEGKIFSCIPGSNLKNPYIITVLKSGQTNAQQKEDNEISSNCK